MKAVAVTHDEKKLPEYEGYVVFDPKTRNWCMGLTRYIGDDAQYTITVSNPSLTALARETERILWEVENEPRKEQLLLPDMGDFQVQYFDPE